MTIDDMAALFRDAASALARIPALDAAVTSLHAANEQAETRIADLLRTLADTRSQLDAATTQLATLTAKRGTFEIDPAFDSERALWHGRLREALLAQHAAIIEHVQKSSAETIGFTVNDYVFALVWSLAGYGDPLVLNEIAVVMSELRKREIVLVGAKDAAFMTSLYALAAYVFTVNKHADADYWRERALAACVNGVPSDDFMHAYAASAETALYLWLSTSDQRWLDDLNVRIDELRRSIWIDADGRAAWFHRPSFAWDKDIYGRSIPATTYISYVFQALAMLDRCGFTVIPMTALERLLCFLTSPPASLYYWMDGQLRANGKGVLCQYDPAKLGSRGWYVFDGGGEIARRIEASDYRKFAMFPAAFVGKANT